MKTERILAWLIVLSVIFGPKITNAESFTVSHDNVTTYTDNTLIEPEKTVYYNVYLSDDLNDLTKWTVVDHSTTLSHPFNTVDYGIVLDQVVWFTGMAVLNTGEFSALSPPYLWVVGHSDNTAPLNVIVKKTSPTNIAISWSANPNFTADRWELLYSSTSYKHLLDEGTSQTVPLDRTSACITVSASDKQFAVVVRARNGATAKTGFSKVGFWLRGDIMGSLDNVSIARVNGLDLGALGKWFNSFVTHQTVDCGTNFVLTPETEQQRASLRKASSITGADLGELGTNFNQPMK